MQFKKIEVKKKEISRSTDFKNFKTHYLNFNRVVRICSSNLYLYPQIMESAKTLKR